MKVGDYVRTDIGEIRKVVRVTDDLYVLDKDIVFAHKDKIKKSSPNIIDLIEVGDYVNGYYVNEITDIDTGLPILCNFDLNTMRWTPLEEIDIWYSIVTKEQFESIEYKVGD